MIWLLAIGALIFWAIIMVSLAILRWIFKLAFFVVCLVIAVFMVTARRVVGHERA